VLGDSFTFGLGVNDHETYVAGLERKLDSTCVGSRVEVVNAGVSGFSTSQQLAMLEHAAAQLEPDVVVVGFFINDPQDNIDKAVHLLVGDSLLSSASTTGSAYVGVLQAKRVVNAIPGYDWLVRHSMLVNWLRRVYFASRQVDPATNPPRWGLEGEPGVAPDSASLAKQWRFTELLYRRFEERVGAMGGELVVALLPDDSTVAHYEEGRRERAETFVRMTQLCQRARLLCVDAAAAIAEAVESTRIGELYLPNEGHFSAAGHLMTAKALAPTVARALGCSTARDATPGTS
jgi:lysophospholipase L1-like esterase